MKRTPKIIKKETLTLLSVIFLLIVTALTVFRLNGNTGRISVKAQATPAINFPQDHGQHPGFSREWWYLNILVRTLDSLGLVRDLGYVISFSRISGVAGLLSSRYNDSNKSFSQNTDYPGNLSVGFNDKGGLRVNYQRTSGPNLLLNELPPLPSGAKLYSLEGTTPQIGQVNLLLSERTISPSGTNSPLLWGCTGNISVFTTNDTYYYSIPDLDITGSVKDVDGTVRNVLVGKAWIDHQWFNSSPPTDWKGHYWSSFHFTTSGNLYDTGPHSGVGFVTQFYASGPRYTYWVKRNADGTNLCGTHGEATPISFYSTNYPSRISITGRNSSGAAEFTADAAPFSSNQIFVTAGLPEFFEPVASISGNFNGVPYTGYGFFETALKGSPPCPSIDSPLFTSMWPTTTVPPEVQTVRWDQVTGAVTYPLRIDDKADDWPPTRTGGAGTCSDVDSAHTTGANLQDICIDSLTGTSYPYTFELGHAYDWWVHARNSCGGWSERMGPVGVKVVLTLNPVADAYVTSESNYKNSNFGTKTTLQVDGSPINTTYIKFDLKSLAGKVFSSAKLRLKVTNQSFSAQKIKRVSDTSWGETSVTYNNKPGLGTTVASFIGGASGVWKEIDVTAVVKEKQGGQMSIAVDAPSTSDDGLYFYSKESSVDKPQLVIQ